MSDLGRNEIADLKHEKPPAGPSGPWAKMETLGRFFMLTVCNSISALVTHAEITHFQIGILILALLEKILIWTLHNDLLAYKKYFLILL